MCKKKQNPTEFYARCHIHGIGSSSPIDENNPMATEASEGTEADSTRDITKIARQNDAE